MNDGSDMVLRVPVSALRPSEYTSALIQALRTAPEKARGKNALEVGSGSGVVLAVLSSLGAASVCGIDVEPEAIEASQRLLAGLGHHNGEFLRGDMWQPVAGRRFDLIVANLPNSPHLRISIAGRPPNWSAGGPDGRLLVDDFIDGLFDHLAPGGRALMTHNSYIGLDRTRDAAQARGLSFSVVSSTLVYVPEEKLALMTPSLVEAEMGRSLYSFGPYTFGEIHIVEFGAPTP